MKPQHVSPVTELPYLHLTTRRTASGTVLVAVRGEIDMATGPVLHAALLDALGTHSPVIIDVDLSACTFLDASGLRVLVAAHTAAQAAGCQMWARYPRRLVRRVLEVTQLLAMFTAANDPA